MQRDEVESEEKSRDSSLATSAFGLLQLRVGSEEEDEAVDQSFEM
jgi:hypothetical protein